MASYWRTVGRDALAQAQQAMRRQEWATNRAERASFTPWMIALEWAIKGFIGNETKATFRQTLTHTTDTHLPGALN